MPSFVIFSKMTRFRLKCVCVFLLCIVIHELSNSHSHLRADPENSLLQPFEFNLSTTIHMVEQRYKTVFPWMPKQLTLFFATKLFKLSQMSILFDSMPLAFRQVFYDHPIPQEVQIKTERTNFAWMTASQMSAVSYPFSNFKILADDRRLLGGPTAVAIPRRVRQKKFDIEEWKELTVAFLLGRSIPDFSVIYRSGVWDGHYRRLATDTQDNLHDAFVEQVQKEEGMQKKSIPEKSTWLTFWPDYICHCQTKPGIVASCVCKVCSSLFVHLDELTKLMDRVELTEDAKKAWNEFLASIPKSTILESAKGGQHVAKAPP